MKSIITLVDAPEPGTTLYVAESLQRFGTVAFGLELMRERIFFGTAPGSVNLGRWFDFVPECYRQAVYDLALYVLDPLYGRKATREMLHRFVTGLNYAIALRLEPVVDEETE